MKIPPQVKISGHLIKVEFVDDLSLEDNARAKYCENTLTIKIASELCQSLQEEGFIHELVHAIKQLNEDPDNEKETARFAQVLYQIIKDNEKEIFIS